MSALLRRLWNYQVKLRHVAVGVLFTAFLLLLVLPMAQEFYLNYRLNRVIQETAPFGERGHAESIRLTKRLLELRPRRIYRVQLSLAYGLQSIALARQERMDEALEAADRAVGAKPDNPAAYSAYAKVLLLGDDWRTAEYMLSRAAYWQSWWDTGQRPRTDSLDYNSGELYFEIAKAAAADAEHRAAARNYYAYREILQRFRDKPLPDTSEVLTAQMAKELALDLDDAQRQQIREMFDTLWR